MNLHLGSLIFIIVCLIHYLAFAQDVHEKVTWPIVKYESSYLRDPFQNPMEEMVTRNISIEPDLPQIKPELTHLHVQGMIWGTNRPQAIINGQVVRQGDVIEGAEVLDVQKEGVYVLYMGNRYVLTPVAPIQQ
jgi:hypothetical protein